MSVTRQTRLAPSPTGALHLGNARTFLVNWALARQNGWRVLLRIDDLDGPRIKHGAMEDLRWLGLDWDVGPVYQSSDLSVYQDALDRLSSLGLTYPCAATRSQIERAASAPHGDDHEQRYPGLYRPPSALSIAAGDEVATRLIVPDGPIGFVDELRGPMAIDVQRQVGDFVVAGKNGLPAYQLSVVVDDARQGVTDIVRGDDLLASTARQRLIYEALGMTPLPRYWHLPLVLGSDGRRLAKRHGDSRLCAYRERGVRSGRVIALLARWSGVEPGAEDMGAQEFAERFSISGLPAGPALFTAEDEAWLLG